MVIERPILFSGPMVHAIRAKRKIHTRRVMKYQPPSDKHQLGRVMDSTSSDRRKMIDRLHWITYEDHAITDSDENYFVCPYGIPGDRLWVRERTRVTAIDDGGRIMVEYEADGARAGWIDWPERLKSKPKLRRCLPYGGFRESSRIDLEVKSIRVERLQDISEADVLAEGLVKLSKDGGRTWKYGKPDRDGEPGGCDVGWPWQDWCLTAKEAFQKAWDKINGKKHPWASNPWLWVIEFNEL